MGQSTIWIHLGNLLGMFFTFHGPLDHQTQVFPKQPRYAQLLTTVCATCLGGRMDILWLPVGHFHKSGRLL